MRLSLQIYSLRNAGDLATQLRLARDAGFEWIESVGTHGLTPERFAQELADHGLRLSSMHVGLAQLEDPANDAVAGCLAAGCSLVVMPFLPRGEVSATAAGWVAMGDRLAGIADRLAADGLRLAYHNHDFEFHTYEGRTALEWLFGAVPAAQLGWEADLGWVRRAGHDPQRWVDQFADRLVAVHVKDIAPDAPHREEDGWCALGRGIVGWPELLVALHDRCDLFIFEHDNPSEYATTLRVSLELMRSTLG